MPNLPSERSFSSFVMERLDFAQVDVADSQTAVALKRNVNAATTGALEVIAFVAPWAGSIVGVSLLTGANKTAGVLTVTPTINGTAITTPTSLVDVALANAAQKKNAYSDAQSGGNRFAAGDLIGAKLTTDANLEPNTLDLEVCVRVVYEDVQP